MNVTVQELTEPLPVEGSPDAAAIVALEEATQERPLPLDAVLSEARDGRAGAVLVARDAEGHIVGMASGRLMVDEAHVIRLAVDEAARRRGIGRALLDGLVTWARERGAVAVLLEVRDGNVAARTLYAGAGFVAEGRRPRYYPDGEDALLWRLTLDARDTPERRDTADAATGRV
jgi:[ribosomal protein S18]-alanine N-acetyltransferase